ncbi:MAG: YkgJ family cysteine cluster protein [Caulobacteraceae bacterium]
MSQTFQDLMFGPPLADRPCGDCIACCVTPVIDTPELKKAEGVVCPNCTGNGCAIYDRRPTVCRDYNCGWKRIASLPIETRPDHCGVMITVESHLPPRNLFENLFLVAVLTKDALDLETPLARDMIAMLSQNVLPVFVFWNMTRHLAHPDPELADAIVNPDRQTDRALVRKGRAWVERYAPFARAAAGDQTKLPYGL